MANTPIPTIPDDFPHGGIATAIAGVQPKLAARLIDGRYVVGETEEERLERYLICEDLAMQLADYCRRKAGKNPDWPAEFNLQRTERGVVSHIRSGRRGYINGREGLAHAALRGVARGVSLQWPKS